MAKMIRVSLILLLGSLLSTTMSQQTCQRFTKDLQNDELALAEVKNVLSENNSEIFDLE